MKLRKLSKTNLGNVKKLCLLLMLLCCGWNLSSCSKEETIVVPDEEEQPGGSTVPVAIQNATSFIADVAGEIYLWSDDIANKLYKLNPATVTDPIGVWENEVQHPDDRWSFFTDDYASMAGSFDGVTVTYGWNITPYRLSSGSNQVGFLVNVVYADGPADRAGIRRGDFLLTYNGEEINTDNYADAYYSTGGEFGVYAYHRAEEQWIQRGSAEMTAVEMYENPVVATNIFDVDGKKVGYLHYTSFDSRSVEQLKEVTREFKAAGVTELILDLRYNGGGLVSTENTMAAMFGPWADTTNRLVYETDVYNKLYTQAWADDLTSYLNVYTASNGQEHTYVDQSLNLNLNKIYAIVSQNTASASESILVGLMPYMDIQIIGSGNTHGKYCTGWMFSAPAWYEQLTGRTTPVGISNWGCYIMVSRYVDKNGNNPCMPNGLTPDIYAKDLPEDGYALGDENETMLAAALQAAGKQGTKALSAHAAASLGESLRSDVAPRTFAVRIDNRPHVKAFVGKKQ